MLVLVLFAPLLFSVLLFIIIFLFDGANRRGDKDMMKFLGLLAGIFLLLGLGAFWIARETILNF